VLLAYVDESYTKEEYWIAALVCEEADLARITQTLDDVVEQAAVSYSGVPPRSELHGYSLFHGKDDWKALRLMPRARIGIYASALEAISSTGARIILRGVDRVGLEQRYSYPDHPHAVVLEHLFERVDEYAASRGEQVLIIADEIDRADSHRRNLWWAQKHSTSGYRSRQLTNIVDTLHFAPSDASRLVQAVDLVAFLHCRISSGADTDTRALAANRRLWKHLEPVVAHCHMWLPKPFRR